MFSSRLTTNQRAVPGQTGPARCEVAAWFISLRWLVPSQKFKLPIIIIIKMPLHSSGSKVTFPAEAERAPQQRGSQIQVAAGCRTADPLRGLLMPNPDGWKGRNTFPVKSPLVAVAHSGVNPTSPHRSSLFPSHGTRARVGRAKCGLLLGSQGSLRVICRSGARRNSAFSDLGCCFCVTDSPEGKNRVCLVLLKCLVHAPC